MSSYDPFIVMRTHRWPYGPCLFWCLCLSISLFFSPSFNWWLMTTTLSSTFQIKNYNAFASFGFHSLNIIWRFLFWFFSNSSQFCGFKDVFTGYFLCILSLRSINLKPWQGITMRSMILSCQLEIVYKHKAANYSEREFEGELIILYDNSSGR